MKKITKLFLIITLTILISSTYFLRYFVKASSTSTNTYFEDFVANSHHRALFVEADSVSKCYLIEGKNPSYMMYDFDNDELLFYCQNSYSPWSVYTANLFSKFGYIYIYNAGYCIINLSQTDSYLYGDIVNIEGTMEVYVKTDADLADKVLEMISIPDTFDFASLFPEDKVEEDVEIPNAYYFKNLNENIGENKYAECTLIALAGLLSYFDTFYDDRIVPDQYMNKEKIYNHHVENAISSPGGKLFYDYLLNEKIKETDEYQSIKVGLERGGYDPWYSAPFARVDLMTDQLLSIIQNGWCTSSSHDDNCSACFSKNFEYVEFRNTHHPSLKYEYTFEQLIGMGLPVVVQIYSEAYPLPDTKNEYTEYPVNYYIPEDGEWNSFSGGHAFICYGYIKVRERSKDFGTYTTTYYKGHNGSRKADGSYRYTQVIYSNRYLDTDYGGDEVSGYTFIPKNNRHVCSKNYLYTKGECSFGICPCDSKLSTKDFYNKYTKVVRVGNKDCYVCKAHNSHILYESNHEHKLIYTQNTETVHTQSCIVEGCSYSVQANHSFNSENYHNNTYHREKCVCGFEKYVEHRFKHILTDDDHYLSCSDCGYAKNGIWNYTEVYDFQHGYYCEECQKMIYEGHDLLHEYIDDTYHRRYCGECSYSEPVPHGVESGWYYWTDSDGSVIKYCPECGYEERQN